MHAHYYYIVNFVYIHSPTALHVDHNEYDVFYSNTHAVSQTILITGLH